MEVKSKEKFIKCSCCCSGLLAEVETETFNLPLAIPDKTLYISLFNRCGYDEKLSWTRRIKFLWHIFTTGKPWADHVVIKKEEAIEFADWLRKNLAE